jgi:hypothetical protein
MGNALSDLGLRAQMFGGVDQCLISMGASEIARIADDAFFLEAPGFAQGLSCVAKPWTWQLDTTILEYGYTVKLGVFDYQVPHEPGRFPSPETD